jgi:hypothetical protein
MKTALLLAIALTIPLAPTLASAQDRDDPVTRFEFEDDLVRGDLVRNDGEILHVRRRRTRDTLIRARESFVAELYKSVENL